MRRYRIFICIFDMLSTLTIYTATLAAPHVTHYIKILYNKNVCRFSGSFAAARRVWILIDRPDPSIGIAISIYLPIPSARYRTAMKKKKGDQIPREYINLKLLPLPRRCIGWDYKRRLRSDVRLEQVRELYYIRQYRESRRSYYILAVHRDHLFSTYFSSARHVEKHARSSLTGYRYRMSDMSSR